MILPTSRAVTFDDLESLLKNQVPEGRHLDYKRAIGKDKEEFAKDVTALANTGGGHLVYGVEEADRVPVALVGDPDLAANPDGVLNSLDQFLSATVEPRLSNYSFKVVDGPEGRKFLVVEVRGLSWNAPHWVKAGGKPYGKFFIRTEAGRSEPMAFSQIRDRFAATANSVDWAEQWVQKRLLRVLGGRTPITIGASVPCLTVFAVPFASQHQFLLASELTLEGPAFLKTVAPLLSDIGDPVHAWRNLEGAVATRRVSRGDRLPIYFQFHRQGMLEYVDALYFNDSVRSKDFNGWKTGRDLCKILDRFWNVYADLPEAKPFLCQAALLGLQGWEASWQERFTEEVILLPPFVIRTQEELENAKNLVNQMMHNASNDTPQQSG